LASMPGGRLAFGTSAMSVPHDPARIHGRTSLADFLPGLLGGPVRFLALPANQSVDQASQYRGARLAASSS
jgi:hypothetical protein